MDKPIFINEPNLPLEIRGYEVNTVQAVFVLTRVLDIYLELSLEAYEYVQCSNVVLSDGQIVDGWVKI